MNSWERRQKPAPVGLTEMASIEDILSCHAYRIERILFIFFEVHDDLLIKYDF